VTLTYNEERHEYKDNGIVIPSVTQIIKTAGLVNLDWVSEETLNIKADLGKKVHSATELYDKNDLDINDLHPTLRLYLDGWIKFRKDYGFIPTEIELQLFHKLYKYAGRIDRVGNISKDLVLIDIKSGTHQKTNAIQTAGYELLYNQDKKKSEQIKKRFIVYLSEQGYKVEEHKNQNDKNIFLSALTITNYLRSL
jgi:hypothetical protein